VEGSYDEFVAIGPAWKEDQLAVDNLSGTGSFIDEARDRSSKIASYFFGAAGQVAADLEAAFREQPKFDLLVSDYTLLGAPPAAEAFGLPWAAVFGLSVPFTVKGWPPFGSHLRCTRSTIVRRRYSAMCREILNENEALYEPVRQLWREAGHTVRDPWQAYARLGTMGIVGSIPECEFPQPPDFPEHIRYVGPLVYGDDERPILDHGATEFVNCRDGFPLVHITLGMTYSRAEPVLRELIKALGDEPLRLLIASGHLDPAQLQQRIHGGRARVLFRQTVPHSYVIPKCDILICHGGANTLMKALHSGIPSLTVPLGAEQRSNGARFAHARIGRMILPSELTPVLIREAVHELLDPAKAYAQRARQLAESAGMAGGAPRAARLLEEICQRRKSL
jgi:MGT family glycosyltransferase